MGIVGLHKSLAFCTKQGSLRDFSGHVLAIDASSWLHKSVYSVSELYVESMEQSRLEPRCVQVSAKYIIRRCQELLNAWRITKVILVMDGKRCPLKADTNQDRESRRLQNLIEARTLKRQGRRYKAEEKYKACIKIRDVLTHAVMGEVEKHFGRDRNVEFLWSPYEADAQLVRLCIDGRADAVVTEVRSLFIIPFYTVFCRCMTMPFQSRGKFSNACSYSLVKIGARQDSDVLVYSAASHFSFPVLFKLDRHSGSCDIIDMGWLLSPPPHDNYAKKKDTSSLETLLRNLALRQFRRPGFGARLFVQACVLAGCDYAPSRLNGVGLVNSFKNIRDNAYRNHSVRFEKVLAALPRKIRNQIDVKDYELILSKSEAVFYYHPILDIDGTITSLNNIRLGTEKPAEKESIQDHFPFLQRYDHDYSFLGDMEPSPPVHEIFIPGKKEESQYQPSDVEMGKILCRSTSRKIENPYRSKKSQDPIKRRPLERVKPNEKAANIDNSKNLFNKFTRKPDTEPSRQRHSGNLKYLQPHQDVRFVKRKFPKIGEPRVSSTLQQACQRQQKRPRTTQSFRPFFATRPKSLVSVAARPNAATQQEFIDSSGANDFEVDATAFDHRCVDSHHSPSGRFPVSSSNTNPLDEIGHEQFDSGLASCHYEVHCSDDADGLGTVPVVSTQNAPIDLTVSDSCMDASYEPDAIGNDLINSTLPEATQTNYLSNEVECSDSCLEYTQFDPCDTIVQSKYFSDQGSARRVTLDPGDRPASKRSSLLGSTYGAALEIEDDPEALFEVENSADPIAPPPNWEFEAQKMESPQQPAREADNFFENYRSNCESEEQIESPQPAKGGDNFYGNYGSNNGEFEEQIESPQPAKGADNFYGNYCSNPFKWKTTKKSATSRDLPFSERSKSKRGTRGTLEGAFQRQRQLARNALGWKQRDRSGYTSQSAKRGGLYDHFKPQSPPVPHIQF